MKSLALCLLAFLPLVLCQRCPNGWEMYSGGSTCVILKMGSPKNFYEAQADCKAYDSSSDLVVVKDDATSTWLGKLVKATQTSFLIGLHDQGKEGKFYWVDGDELYLQKKNPNWNPGEPNNSGGEDCVQFKPNSKWNDISCYAATNFICQRPNDVPLDCDEENGWKVGVDSCFKYYDTGMAWSSARKYCQNRDGDLIKIDSTEEQNAIHTMSVADSWQSVWIGLTDKTKNVKGQYWWVDDTVIGSNTFWAANQPNNGFFDKGGNCAQILNSPADGKWTTAACTDSKQFACEKPKGTCAPGWRIHGGRCYNFYTNTPMTWYVAKHTCESHGGFLVSIQSEDENSFLAMQFDDLSDVGINFLWMGASDSKTDGTFEWSDGTSMAGYSKWVLPTDQQNTKYTDCGYYDTSDSEGKWNLGNCFEVRPFICEIKAGEKVHPIDPNVGVGKCQPGWNLFNNFCYFFDTTIVDYDTAKQKCLDKQSQLTSILDVDEQSYLSMRTYTFQTYLWIGLNDKAQQNVFVWEDGSPYSYSYWAPGQPDHYGNNEKCVHFRYGELEEGMWNDLPCANVFCGYICKKKAEPGVPSTPKPPPTPMFSNRCGLGWEYDPSSEQCYLFKPGSLKKWQGAREKCREGGGDLVSITGLAEQTYLQARLALETSATVVWIGANDILKEGGWEWSDDSAFKYLNWAGGEPNNVGPSGEHCAEFYIGDGTWNDVDCTKSRGYVCKKDGYLVSHFFTYPNMFLDISSVFIQAGVYPDACAVSCMFIAPPYVCLAFNYDTAKKECHLLDSNKDLVGGLKTSVDFDYYEITKDAQLPTARPTLPPNYRCPADWQGYDNYCYQVSKDDLSWSEARKTCRLKGADLISIRDTNENKFMVTIMSQEAKPGDNIEFWIGLNDNKVSLTYEWSDDSPVLFTNWDDYEPNNHQGTNEDCVESYVDGFWNDQECLDLNRYICKMPKQDLPPTLYPVTPSGCDKGWIAYESSCYFIEDQTATTRDDALAQCNNYGANLVAITDKYEQSVITTQLGQQLWSKTFWIGLHDLNLKGFYEWEGGAQFLYDNWAKGQPDGNKGDCVFAITGVSAGLWNVGFCNGSRNYMCEKGRAGYTTVKPPTVKTTPTNTNCAPDWIGYGLRCFKPFNLAPLLQFWDAETFCLNIGAHLASFHSKDEEDYIVQQANKKFGDTDDSFWIGLHDSKTEGGFEWVDGSPVGWTNWHLYEPNDAGSGEDCTEMYFNGHGWNDLSCLDNYRNAICVLPKGQMPATTRPPVTPKKCPSGDEGFFLFNDYCYYISPVGDQLGWAEAEDSCHKKGAHLASIHGQDVQDYLTDQVASYGRGDCWIGLREYTKSGIYRWSDNSSLDYDAWVSGEPNDYNGEEECVEMYPWTDSINKGNWNDQNCGTPRNYICKKDINSIGPITHRPTEAPKGNCPKNAVKFLNRCYIFFGTEQDTRLSWRNASNECKKIPGAELATIHSQAVQALLTSYLDRYSIMFWIGLSDITTNRQFKWVDGTTVDFTNWRSGEPNEANGEEDCVEMYYDWYRAGTWNDMSCDQLNGYICQTKPDPSNKPPLTPISPCESGYSYWPSTESCFKVLPKPVGFSDAIKACQNLGSKVSLASLNSPYEAAFADGLMVAAAANDEGAIGEEKPLWLGMLDDKVAGEYRWLDNWPIFFTKWDTSEPSKGSGEGCVAMAFNGRWDDKNCNNKYGSLCKYTMAPTPTHHPDQPGTCPNDWVPYGGFCFFFPPADAKLLSRFEAQGECSKYGANLATVRTQVENTFISNKLLAISNNRAWIGLSRSDEGGFEWQDLEPVKFVYWAPGQPSMTWNGEHENCVEMYTDIGEWNDVDCNQLRTYACKISKIRPTTVKPTAVPPHTAKPLKGGLSTGGIVGIVLGVLVFVLVAFLAVFFFTTGNRAQKGPIISDPGLPDLGNGFDNVVYSSTEESLSRPEPPVVEKDASEEASNA